jgi:hypothetical protein
MANVHRPVEVPVHFTGKNGEKVRAMLLRRFDETDLAGKVDPGTQGMVVAEYMRNGRYRTYARGGIPAKKFPVTEGDRVLLLRAEQKRDRRAKRGY